MSASRGSARASWLRLADEIRSDDKRPDGRPIQTAHRGDTRYELYPNGELWTMGRYGFRCGYVADLEFGLESAIDAHEEEMLFLMKEFA